ncbi:MAG: hypothetical protein H0V45_02500 [Actinobacteria bacterium]|nr:hypothetical protein [Actinomycetota bacterium]
MRSALVGAALTYVLLLAAPAAHAARFGIADDAGKYAEGDASFFRQVRALGMTENRITVHWQPDRPRTIVEKAFLDRSLAVGQEEGVRVVFHVFALSPTAMTASPDAVENFTSFLELLAGTYPEVREYVVGNEPNQPRFWQPQFTPSGRGAAAAAYAELLGRSYDALTEGSRPGHPRDRARALRQGQRSAVRALERVVVAGAVPARPRRRLPGERPAAPRR